MGLCLLFQTLFSITLPLNMKRNFVPQIHVWPRSPVLSPGQERMSKRTLGQQAAIYFLLNPVGVGEVSGKGINKMF